MANILMKCTSFVRLNHKWMFPNFINGTDMVPSPYSRINVLNKHTSYSSHLDYKKDLHCEQETETCETRLLKVAIVGVPNAGKSTIINKLVGRRVCSVSSKVHTTRSKARAIAIHGDTQIIFLDTPGLVTVTESQRHNLERAFLSDGEMAMLEADVIGVIHDVSNPWTRDRLDPKVLRLLHLYPRKHSFLMLNKIDAIKSKRKLLDVARILTNHSHKDQQPTPDSIVCRVEHLKETRETVLRRGDDDKSDSGDDLYEQLSEHQVSKKVQHERGWSHFKEVFMISALNGEGTDDVRDYLVHISEPSPWLYPESQFTDQPSETVVLDTVRSKLLDNLPQEVPYNLKVQMEYFEMNDEGTISSVVLVCCPSPRIGKMLIGSRGIRIREIARSAEQELQSTFMQPVRLKVVVRDPK